MPKQTPRLFSLVELEETVQWLESVKNRVGTVTDRLKMRGRNEIQVATGDSYDKAVSRLNAWINAAESAMEAIAKAGRNAAVAKRQKPTAMREILRKVR